MVGEPHDAPASSVRFTAPRLEPSIGEQLAGRFRIERCLGRGARGTVYAAYDRAIEDTVALKLLDATGEEGLRSFRREVRLARRVTHRNVARIFDLGEIDGTPFITLELVDGESLRVRLVREGHLPLEVALGVAHQVALGLHAAHQVDVLHRDLRPTNVLLEPCGRAVITDLGVADPTGPRPLASPYAAPEQRGGGPIDARADLYALATIVLTMLTGEAPAPDHARPALPPELPPSLARLFRQCMARDPRDRPASVHDLLAPLEAWLAERPTAPPPEPAPSSPPRLGSPPVRELSVAVLPFRDRGPAVPDRPAAAFREALVELLTMTHGVRVSTHETTRRVEQLDASARSQAPGVDAVVEGTVQLRGDQVRIVVRLVGVPDGFQRWSGRFGGHLPDPSALRELMAKRVAEALREELTLLRYSASAPAGAIELYRRGRARAAPGDGDPLALEQSAELLEQAHALAPALAPAVAARADAVVRRWFFSAGADGQRWYQAAREAVRLALAEADALPETHLAAARFEANRGNFTAAAHHLTATLSLAPTYPAAHEYLGMLQCDAGRSDQGVEHIQLAHRLDPSLGNGLLAMLHSHALRGRAAAFEELLVELRQSVITPRFTVALFDFRFALWTDDLERARTIRWPTKLSTPFFDVSQVLDATLDPATSDAELVAMLDETTERMANPRMRAAWLQIAVELLAWRSLVEPALKNLARADSEGTLLDADWLEGCPVLTPLRPDPRFVATVQRVRARADAIWQLGRQGG